MPPGAGSGAEERGQATRNLLLDSGTLAKGFKDGEESKRKVTKAMLRVPLATILEQNLAPFPNLRQIQFALLKQELHL